MTLAGEGVAAFCTHATLAIEARGPGPLAGMRFAVKDVFAVTGHAACFGNPTWLATHRAATTTAPAVEKMLASGASLIGVTVTDELAFSLTGENSHYGTPVNSAAPDRVPGGSSSGSAAAVAGAACDFALGTDTGGSVRVPASHCGLWGFRPTHGAVGMEGALPFAPTFDTVGWFARDAATLAVVGEVLLSDNTAERADVTYPTVGGAPAGALATASLAPALEVRRVLVLVDAVALADPAARMPLARAFRALAPAVGLRAPQDATAGGGESGRLTDWLQSYAALQNADLARTHGAWLEECRPKFGALIEARVARAVTMARDTEALDQAARHRLEIRARIAALLTPGSFLAIPSACGVAPTKGRSETEIDEETGRSLTLSCVASLCGLPQITMPLCQVDGLPIGISLIGGAGQDRALLALGRQIEGCRGWPAGRVTKRPDDEDAKEHEWPPL